MPVSLELSLATLSRHALALSEPPSLILKAAVGKARSARNALKHGLNLPVLADPMPATGVEEPVNKIAGADAGSTTLRVGKTKLENPIVSTAACRGGIPWRRARAVSPAFWQNKPKPGQLQMTFWQNNPTGITARIPVGCLTAERHRRPNSRSKNHPSSP
jgi:hypothetical protein